ncbi:uncharacterized protein O3C94_008629 [Discoglossus pictus]
MAAARCPQAPAELPGDGGPWPGLSALPDWDPRAPNRQGSAQPSSPGGSQQGRGYERLCCRCPSGSVPGSLCPNIGPPNCCWGLAQCSPAPPASSKGESEAFKDYKTCYTYTSAMKFAIAFLLVTLTYCYDTVNADIQDACLDKLFQNDAPQFLKSLGNLLCKYQIAKEQQNQDLFLEFLNGVNSLLEGVGCTVDDLLGIDVVPTLENAEKIADSVATVLFNFVNALLSSVTSVLKDLPSFLTDIVEDIVPETAALLDILEHINDVKDVACDVLVKILPEVAEILEIGGHILEKVMDDLGIKVNEKTLPIGV